MELLRGGCHGSGTTHATLGVADYLDRNSALYQPGLAGRIAQATHSYTRRLRLRCV
jgi:hypothetical protein